MKIIKILKIALLLICIFFLSPKYAQSQLINNGGLITVTNTAVLFVDSSFTNTANATVTNNGSIIANNSIINDAGSSLSGDGTYRIQADFTNTGTYNQGSSTLYFFGSANSSLKNASGNIYTLEISKDENKYVTLSDAENILNSVIFTSDKNWIKLGNRVLTLSTGCTVTGYSNKRYFITNGNGSLKKQNISNSAFTFPVGFDKSTYNPLSVTENGTADDYSVRCLQHALLNGADGNAISTDGIDASWVVEEQKTGGSNAIIQAEWKKDDELFGFDYTHCMVVRYKGSDWDFKNNLAGTATGDPYRTIARSGFSSLGYFTVLSNKNPTFVSAVYSMENNSVKAAVNRITNFKVYPTIVQNNLNIDVPFNNNVQKMNIHIIDGSGKIVWQKQNADYQSQKILLPNLSAGYYSVLIDYNKTKFVQKIIISR